MRSCCCYIGLLATCANAALYAASTGNLQTEDQFNLQLISSVDGSGTVLTNLTTVGGLLPGAFSHIVASDAVMVAGLGTESYSNSDLTVVSVKEGTAGTVIARKVWKGQLTTNAHYDRSTNTTWISAADLSASPLPKGIHPRAVRFSPTVGIWGMTVNATGELNLVRTVTLPANMVVESGLSSFCSIGGVFFLTIRDDDTPNGAGIIRVSVKEKKILTQAPLQDAVEALLWDETSKTMYAWFATETAAGVLGTIDPVTGKTLTTIATFPELSANSGNGASSTLDVHSGTVYASLINHTDSTQIDGTPTFVTVDVKTGASTVGGGGGEYLISIA
jgi:hypothetical protein